MILKGSASSARKYHHLRQYKISVFLQGHQKHFPMSLFFFIAFIPRSILFFKSAMSLTFVLYTFVLTCLHGRKSSDVKSGERGAQEIGPSSIKFFISSCTNFFGKMGRCAKLLKNHLKPFSLHNRIKIIV